MKSLQKKLIHLITVALLTLAILAGGLSIYNTNRIVTQDSELMMNAVCTEQALRLDNQLTRVEQAVTTIYHYAQSELTSMNDVYDEQLRQQYTEKVRVLALDIAEYTVGAMAVYFRYDPASTNGTSGFFWSKAGSHSGFKYERPTDLSVYSPDDVEHVGWFYQPVEAGKALWMSPYYNKNIDVEMISYVVPFFHDGTLVGVIGMDIDFSVFVDLAQEASLYEEGNANLVDLNTKTLYYREDGDDAVTMHKEEITEELYSMISKKSTNGEHLLDFTYEGVEYKLSYATTQNGMRFILAAPSREINHERYVLMISLFALTVGILVMFLGFTIFMTKRITKPLGELNEAAKQMAEGNLDVTLTCRTNDEIGTLTDSINVMAQRLKEYVGEINALAYTDSLTGVKNKTGYMECTERLMKDSGKEYAVVVFDVNNLKMINDQYGHECGDSLIQLSANYISHCFPQSEIFRIGGDEFVVILSGESYEQRSMLMNDFEKNMSSVKMPFEPYAALSIAGGMAESSRDLLYYEVFRMADQRMYEHKREMKSK